MRQGYWAMGGPATSAVASRPLLASEYRVPPTVRLTPDGHHLVWTTAGDWRAVDIEQKSEELLEEFVALARDEASPESIRDYARRWGVLGICRHGQPATHVPHAREDEPCEPVGRRLSDGEFEVREPLAAWRSLAGRTRALVEIAEWLQEGRLGTPKDWRELIGPPETAAFGPPGRNLAAQRRSLAAHVTNWLGDAGIRPRVVWSESAGFWLRPEIDTFFAALALSAALALAGAAALYRCDDCGNAFTPVPSGPGKAPRKPRGDKRRYCMVCRENGAPQRYRDAQARKRRIEEATRHGIGKPSGRRAEGGESG